LYELDRQFDAMHAEYQPVAFMGTLKRPDGTPRLVVIYGDLGWYGNGISGIGGVIMPLPGIFGVLPTPITQIVPQGNWYVGPMPDPAELQSGSVDPNDPSHVTFPFLVGPMSETWTGGTAVPGTINFRGWMDVYLQNDDTVRFALRGPPEFGPGSFYEQMLVRKHSVIRSGPPATIPAR
jgi:hypothetical protein